MGLGINIIDNKIMRKYFLMGVGCGSTILLGFILLFVVLYCTGTSSLDEGESKPQNIEVSTDKGTFTIHTLMEKDSVILILGEPLETKIHTYGNDVEEILTYKSKNNSDLELKFENGVLKRVDSW